MPEKQTRSRRDIVVEEEVEVLADYMIEFFNDIMWSADRVSYQDIKAWCELKGIQLSRWEIDTLSIMLPSYYSMLYDARSPNCLSPLLTEKEKMIQLAKINMAKMDGK